MKFPQEETEYHYQWHRWRFPSLLLSRSPTLCETGVTIPHFVLHINISQDSCWQHSRPLWMTPLCAVLWECRRQGKIVPSWHHRLLPGILRGLCSRQGQMALMFIFIFSIYIALSSCKMQSLPFHEARRGKCWRQQELETKHSLFRELKYATRSISTSSHFHLWETGFAEFLYYFKNLENLFDQRQQ